MSTLIDAFKKELQFTKKALGQHFLTNTHFLDEIVESCELTVNDRIIEIGPGCGVLTERLLATNADLTAIEIDYRLTRFLKKNLGEYKNFTLINDDATKVDLDKIYENQTIKIAGNLPYNLSVKILELAISQIDRTEAMVFMFQKEVADRINAKPKTKAYSSLSIFVSYHCDIKKIRDIGGGNFMPNANVTSSVLKFTPKKVRGLEKAEEKDFFHLVRMAFTQKRKTIKNNLLSIHEIDTALLNSEILPNKRAEELSAEQFITLFRAIKNV